MTLLNKFSAATFISASVIFSAQPSVAMPRPGAVSDLIDASHRDGRSFRNDFQRCVRGAISSGDADYAARRILREFPLGRPYARQPAVWNDFKNQVAREICRLEQEGYSRPVHLGPYNLTIEPRLLQRAPRYNPVPAPRQGPVIIIPLPFNLP